jgi:hypothetical protein
MLRISRWTLLILAASTAVCSAATSPIGRPLKFYEASQTRILRVAAPGETCSSTSQITCVTSDAIGNATFSNVETGAVTVSASSGRSMLCVNTNGLVLYTFRGRTGASDLASFRIEARYEIRSALLDDASLINPVTGMPFAGRITFQPQLYFVDQDYVGPLQRMARTQKVGSMDCGGPLLTYQMLTTTYGLSSLQAQRLLAQSITIRQIVNGSAMMVDGATYSLQLRMLGD